MSVNQCLSSSHLNSSLYARSKKRRLERSMASSRKRSALSPLEDNNVPRTLPRTVPAGKRPILYRPVVILRPPVPAHGPITHICMEPGLFDADFW